jgi:hypothetical protein
MVATSRINLEGRKAMSDLSFREIHLAVYYWGAFTATWLVEHQEEGTELRRRRWLERHLVESAATSRGERLHGY